MRACMVAYTYYDMDNRVRRYAEALIEEGWEVDAITLQSESHEYPYQLKGVTVYGIQKRMLNEKNKLSYLFRTFKFLVNSFWFLTKKQITKKYDLVHVHSVPDFEVFAALIPKLTGAKIILDIHDIVPELYMAKFRVNAKSSIFKALVGVEKLSAFFADYVIIANHIWYKRIISRSIDESKCSVVLNYPDEKIFGNVNRTRYDDEFVMLYPGTLSKHQGIDVAIRAIDLIKDEVPKLKFKIYGKGTDESYLRDLVNELGLSDKIHFYSPVSLEEIAQVMANADMGIEPKSSDGFSNEAFSTKILEFMLLGVPVVASDTAIHKHYIDESTVKYFKAGSVMELALCIKSLYDNQSVREQLILKSRSFVKTMCWSIRKKEYFGIIQKLIPDYLLNSNESAAINNVKF